jgi:hypothetical protein
VLEKRKVKKERFETGEQCAAGIQTQCLGKREGELFGNYFAIASIY